MKKSIDSITWSDIKLEWELENTEVIEISLTSFKDIAKRIIEIEELEEESFYINSDIQEVKEINSLVCSWDTDSRIKKILALFDIIEPENETEIKDNKENELYLKFRELIFTTKQKPVYDLMKQWLKPNDIASRLNMSIAAVINNIKAVKKRVNALEEKFEIQILWYINPRLANVLQMMEIKSIKQALETTEDDFRLEPWYWPWCRRTLDALAPYYEIDIIYEVKETPVEYIPDTLLNKLKLNKDEVFIENQIVEWKTLEQISSQSGLAPQLVWKFIWRIKKKKFALSNPTPFNIISAINPQIASSIKRQRISTEKAVRLWQRDRFSLFWNREVWPKWAQDMYDLAMLFNY